MNLKLSAAEVVTGCLTSGLISFAVAYWVWPWLGPQLLNPCPQWTALGIGLYTFRGVLRGIGILSKSNDRKALKEVARQRGIALWP